MGGHYRQVVVFPKIEEYIEDGEYCVRITSRILGQSISSLQSVCESSPLVKDKDKFREDCLNRFMETIKRWVEDWQKQGLA